MVIIYIFLIIIFVLAVLTYFKFKSEIVANTQKLMEDKKNFIYIYALKFTILFLFFFVAYSSTGFLEIVTQQYLKIDDKTVEYYKSLDYNYFFENYPREVLYILIAIVIYSFFFIKIYSVVLNYWRTKLMPLFTKFDNFIIVILNIIFIFQLLVIKINCFNLIFILIKKYSFYLKFNILNNESCRGTRKKVRVYREDEYVQLYIDNDAIIRRKLSHILKNNKHKSYYDIWHNRFVIFFDKLRNLYNSIGCFFKTIKKILFEFKHNTITKINSLEINLLYQSIIKFIYKFFDSLKILAELAYNYKLSRLNFCNNYSFFYKFLHNSITLSGQNFHKLYTSFCFVFRPLSFIMVDTNFTILFFIFAAMLYTIVCIFLFFLRDLFTLVFNLIVVNKTALKVKSLFLSNKKKVLYFLCFIFFFIFKFIQYSYIQYVFYAPKAASESITLFFKNYVDPNNNYILLFLILFGISSHFNFFEFLKRKINITYLFLFLLYIVVVVFCTILLYPYTTMHWLVVSVYYPLFFFVLLYYLRLFLKKLKNIIKKYFYNDRRKMLNFKTLNNYTFEKYSNYEICYYFAVFVKDEVVLYFSDLISFFFSDKIAIYVLNKIQKIYFFGSYFVNNWLLTTNHKRISVLYFIFIIITSFVGLLLATIIRVELAYPGRSILNNNSEKYLTIISLHGIVMVFFVVIPAIFGAFGNFLLPTQLCVRDVAFPRLNSFMFWVTPSGFILILHIFFYDKNPYTLSFQNNTLNKNFKHINSHVEFCKKNKINYKYNNIDSTKKNNISYLSDSTATNEFDLLSGFVDINTQVKFTNKFSVNYLIEVINFNFILFYKNLNFLSSYFYSYKNNILDVNFNNLSKFNIKVSSWVSNQLIPGWAFITPYSSRLNFTSIGKVDLSLVVIFSAGLGSLFSSVNYVITYKCLCSNSILSRRELKSFFVDSLLVASRMMMAANPALLIAILFLLSDRHLNTSIFDFSGGGDAVLFQHLFWFFGHPEVYIIVIPCFGFVNSLLPYFLKKRLSGRLSLQFSMYTIAFMGFAVWGHHMYMVGLANTTRTLYSTMTVMISVPASTKVLHWCVTLINSSPQVDVSFLFILAFIYFFTLGGLSGMFVAHIGFDILFHDTFYVIGHFHVMLAGAATSCIFAAFYFYFNAITNVQYSSFFGYLHFFFYFFGQLFTVIPMFWLGYSGMPRRIMDYPSYFGGWHSIISGGHILSLIGYFFFLLMIVDSLLFNKSVKKKKSNIRFNNRFQYYLNIVNNR